MRRDEYKCFYENHKFNTCDMKKTKFIECNSENCDKLKCSNNFISRIGKYELNVMQQDSQGKGVRLGRQNIMSAHTYIGEYTGHVKPKRAISNDSSYSAKISRDHVVDAGLFDNILKFINHSCNPNARLEVWYSEGNF
jgi:SET domain-containing protein